MKTLILLFHSIVLSTCILAQNNIVNLKFEVDGKYTEYKNGIAKFIFNKDTIVVNIDSNKLDIPVIVFKKRATVIFYLDKYILHIDSIPLSINDQYPNWVLGVDEKPFDKKKFTVIKKWRKIQIVYYLKNNYGSVFTFWRYQKSLAIK